MLPQSDSESNELSDEEFSVFEVVCVDVVVVVVVVDVVVVVVVAVTSGKQD